MLDNQIEQDEALKKELDKIDWKQFIRYGNIRIQIREGEKTLTIIERTYPD